METARDLRQFGLIRVATGGSKEEATRWIEERMQSSGQKPGRSQDDLKAAQRASLEALGIKVEE